MQIDLSHQVVLVTGGSRGIGAAAVKLFCQAGARVAFSYRKAASSARQVVRDCARQGGQSLAIRSEAASMVAAKKLVETTVRRFGQLDVLVANAGIWNVTPTPIERMTEKQWDEMIAINLKGVYAVIHYAVPVMKRQKSGSIIVVSSTAGQRGEAFHTHYGASKGGVISLVKGLSTELAAFNIRVNCVAPGWVETDMSTSVLKNRREYGQAIKPIPMGRFARPEEIAGPILFVASEMASYMTGEIVNVNGGNILCG
jgi:3-oxoacyl-[acyl-carrier protein] reductase